MAKVVLFRERQFYKNKFDEKDYLTGGEGDKTLMAAAMLTGKGLESEKETVHTAYGETLEEAKKSMNVFLKEKPEYLDLETEEFE